MEYLYVRGNKGSEIILFYNFWICTNYRYVEKYFPKRKEKVERILKVVLCQASLYDALLTGRKMYDLYNCRMNGSIINMSLGNDKLRYLTLK